MFVAIHLFLSSILYLYNTNYFWILVCLQLFLIVVEKRKKNTVVLAFLVLLSIRVNFFQIEPLFNHPFLVTKMTSESTTFRQWGLNFISEANSDLVVGDIVRIEGTFKPTQVNQENASLLISHYIGRVKAESITKVGQSIKTRWLHVNTRDSEISRKVFLNHSVANDNELLNLVVSSGLMLSVFYSFLKRITALFFEKKTMNHFLLIGLTIVFGVSFGIIRLIIKEVVSATKISRKQAPLIELVLLLLIYPLAIYTLVFWLIAVFKIQNLLFEKKHRTIKRILLITTLQLMINYKINLLTTVFFGFFRSTSLFVFILSLAEVVMNISFPITMIESMLAIVNDFFSNRFVIVGQMNIGIGLLIMFVIIKEKKIENLLLTVSLLLLVYYFSIYGNGGYRVIYLDVKQGDSTLLISPYLNEVFLIDTGKESEYFSLQKALNQYGIQKIDGIIITHYDNDHSGNLENILMDYQVNQIVDQKNLRVKTKDFSFNYYLEEVYFDSENDNSLIFEVLINEFSFLFTGDASKKLERLLLHENPSLDVFVHKLGHHGSRTSTDDYFIGKILPSFVVISSDPTVYGHPHTEVLQTILNYNIKTFETAKHHHIEFRLNKLYSAIFIKKQILFIKR